MRAVRFLPLVFVIGVHGFVLFAPYITLLLATMYTLKWFKRDEQPRVVPIRVRTRFWERLRGE